MKRRKSRKDARAKAYADREREDAEAWRNPTPTGVTGDPWVDAVLALNVRNDVEPLANYVDSTNEITQEQRRALARLLLLLHARLQKRGRGRPGGTLSRWSNPNYIAAKFAERRIDEWKRDAGRQNIPEEIRDAIIREEIDYVNTWHFVKTRGRANIDRVKAILDGPKTRRL
jgi:hypothetical protein